MKTDPRTPELEAAFAEGPAQIGELRLRSLSFGTINLCRQLNLSLFLDEQVELPEEEKQRQLVAFAWVQSAPLSEVLEAVRTGKVQERLDAFAFSLSIGMLPALMAEVSRISRLAAAAAVEVMPKPGDRDDEGAPPNC
ncbi:MAG: hypothetical protein KDK97_11925 [Verrucomicrobiales bacterium]|nr:hypothetical protein [Verrucomicrobiales bacterium]MCP5560678.1 hypothetical protein [Verrucomicrobiaceae bacterium]